MTNSRAKFELPPRYSWRFPETLLREIHKCQSMLGGNILGSEPIFVVPSQRRRVGPPAGVHGRVDHASMERVIVPAILEFFFDATADLKF
jgi:hypothetical protein